MASKDLSAQIASLNEQLDKGAIDEAEYDRRAAPLFKIGDIIQAISAGDAAKLKTLISENSGINLNDVEEKGATIMHLAVSTAIRGKGNGDVINALVAAKVNVNPTLSGMTPLLRVCDANAFANDIAVASALIKGGASVNFAAKTATFPHYTPLSAAITRGRSAELVKLLLDNKADPNVDVESGPALVHAAIYDLNEYAQLLIKAGANVNAREKEKGANCLASAISNFNVDLVRWLIEAGADRNAGIMTDQRASAVDLAKQLVRLNAGDPKFEEILRILQ